MRLLLLCVFIFVVCIVVCEPILDKPYTRGTKTLNENFAKAEDGWTWIKRGVSDFVYQVADGWRKSSWIITLPYESDNKAEDGLGKTSSTETPSHNFVSTAKDRWRKTSWENIPFDAIVEKAEHYKRPFVRNKRGTGNYEQHHEAVAVTTQDGEKWLIEKGDGYASKAYYDVNSYPFRTSDTIVITWEYRISSTWTRIESERVTCARTVKEFMTAALLDRRYDMYESNCQHAAERMMTLAKDKRCYIREVGPHYPWIKVKYVKYNRQQ